MPVPLYRPNGSSAWVILERLFERFRAKRGEQQELILPANRVLDGPLPTILSRHFHPNKVTRGVVIKHYLRVAERLQGIVSSRDPEPSIIVLILNPEVGGRRC